MKTNKLVIFLLIILAIILGFSFYYFYSYSKAERASNLDSGIYVSEIIDGDTFKLSSGETIRLLCVDTPERGKARYDESGDFLASLILGEEVRMEKDVDDVDKYGRLLRYVYVNDSISGEEIFVNREIVIRGYGSLFVYGNVSCGRLAG